MNVKDRTPILHAGQNEPFTRVLRIDNCRFILPEKFQGEVNKGVIPIEISGIGTDAQGVTNVNVITASLVKLEMISGNSKASGIIYIGKDGTIKEGTALDIMKSLYRMCAD
jgi:hypothetical protein